MENAERREARLEKEKAAEKAEVKGGIHGRLEKGSRAVLFLNICTRYRRFERVEGLWIS